MTYKQLKSVTEVIKLQYLKNVVLRNECIKKYQNKLDLNKGKHFRQLKLRKVCIEIQRDLFDTKIN